MNPELYKDKVKEKLSKTKNNKAEILISGAGDEDALAFTHKVVSELPIKWQLTLIDFCSTALQRNKEYAEKNSIPTNFVFNDILKYEPKNKFDLIISDGIIDFFDDKGKQKLLNKWNSFLKKEGIIITTIPIEQPAKQIGNTLREYFQIALKSIKKKCNPFQKIIGYHNLVHACNKLQAKGKNKAFKTEQEFYEICEQNKLEVTLFKKFYEYHNPRWAWHSCVIKKQNPRKIKERKELTTETTDMIMQEKNQLKEYELRLEETLHLNNITELDKNIIMKNKQDIQLAVNELEYFEEFIKNTSNKQAFNEAIKLGNYVFRKSIAARTSMLRHTPTLRGLPVSLSPNQNHQLSPKLHTVEYGRGGYILFQQPHKEPKTLFKDHPELKEVANKMKNKFYDNPTNTEAIIFTCGLGAINTFNDYLRSLSRKNFRDNYLGENCWLELKKQVSESGDNCFVFFDETDKTKIRELLEDENVQSICLEGIQNYATLRASNLDEIMSIASKTVFKKPKFLVIDHVMTFDTKIFTKYFSKKMPKNFCLIAFTSGIKFIQGGWDISKSGFLFMKYNKEDFDLQTDPYQRVLEIRAGSGRVPSLEEAHLSNIDTKKSLKSKMKRYDRNMKMLAEQLQTNFTKNGLGNIYSAWLPNHPDYKIARNCYSNGGRILYLKLSEKKFPEQKLLRLYRFLADQAVNEKIPLMAASNFGFSTPHIHLVRQNKVGLSLRISSGSTDSETTKRIGEFITEKIEEFT